MTGINLCFGDWFFWQGLERVSYRGSFANWPNFFSCYLRENKVTDIVLLGEQRRYHKQAVEIAQSLGVRVTVTDFGYLRPDWITLERDGMGGNSRFPKDPNELLRLASSLPAVNLEQRFSDSSGKMSAGDLGYMIGNLCFWWLYPRYNRTDMRPHPLLYMPASAKRGILSELKKNKASLYVQSLIESNKRFFVFPLQLNHDFQIVAYSPFPGLAEAIEQVLVSFSKYADSETRLVVKLHPWDPGLVNWKRMIEALATQLGVSERVDYLDGGDLDALIKSSVGMVTVNSTSGIRALQLACPVKILGQAIYDIKGLVHEGSLDEFWNSPQQPDPELMNAFIKVMVGSIQIRGVFFNEPGLSLAVEAAASRLYDGTVGDLIPVTPEY